MSNIDKKGGLFIKKANIDSKYDLFIHFTIKFNSKDYSISIFWEYSIKQGNYSLRRPPKLFITKNIRWPKMGYHTQIHVSSNNCQKASPSRPQIWHLYVWPIYQHSTIIRVTVKKRHHLAPRFGTCMYDPYTSTQPS